MSRSESMTHEQARELLPWLVNDSLEAEERELVGEHAKSCVICRRELAELERLQVSIAVAADSAAVPAPDMRHINARIDALIEKENRSLVLMSRIRDFVSSPWRAAFAAQSAVLVALATVLLWPQPERPDFITLTTPQDRPDGHYIRVVFDPSIDAVRFTALLEELQLTIVDGPSERGVATLRVAPAVSVADRDELVSDLLVDPGVLFAEPVRARDQP